MAYTYFATRISENISRTPEDFLVCTDCVIGRTGFQQYKVGDLPQSAAEELGIDISDWSAMIDLYRPPEEVFARATIASFEGKPVCLQHPPEFVDASNARQYTRGHLQNVRKGAGPLESGEWPLVADLILTDAEIIAQIEGGRRELSCGYDYTLAREGRKLLQTAIVGNHVALVDKARAGAEARINDGATEVLEAIKEVVPPTKSEAVKPDVRPQIKRKEYPVTNVLKNLLGRGLKALAADENIDPEKLAEAAAAAHRATGDESEEEEEKKKKEKDAADKRARDESEEKEKKEREAKDAADKKAKDEAEKAHFTPCAVKDCMARDCRMHGALDEALKAHPEEDDADMKDLQELMATHGGTMAQHDNSEVIEPITEGEGDSASDRAGAADAAAADAAEELALLKEMRPVIARSNDSKLIAHFNARLKRFTRGSQVGDGSYSGVAAAAGAARQRQDQNGGNKQAVDYSELNAQYASRRGKIDQEVK